MLPINTLILKVIVARSCAVCR